MSHTQLIISPKLKHKIDKYVRYIYVNVVNIVLFAKTSKEGIEIIKEKIQMAKIQY